MVRRTIYTKCDVSDLAAVEKYSHNVFSDAAYWHSYAKSFHLTRTYVLTVECCSRNILCISSRKTRTIRW